MLHHSYVVTAVDSQCRIGHCIHVKTFVRFGIAGVNRVYQSLVLLLKFCKYLAGVKVYRNMSDYLQLAFSSSILQIIFPAKFTSWERYNIIYERSAWNKNYEDGSPIVEQVSLLPVSQVLPTSFWTSLVIITCGNRIDVLGMLEIADQFSTRVGQAAVLFRRAVYRAIAGFVHLLWCFLVME